MLIINIKIDYHIPYLVEISIQLSYYAPQTQDFDQRYVPT